MQAVDEAMETVEILRDAIAAKNKSRASEAVTVLLLRSMSVAGHDLRTFASTFRLLEDVKDYIKAEDYESASEYASELLFKLRTAREAARPAWTH